MKKVILYFFVFLLVAGSFGHLLKPEVSDGFIPAFLSKQIVHGLAFIVELSIGIGLLIPKFRHKASWAAFVLMCLFLPIHLFDLLQAKPIIGSHTVAGVRLAFQFVFIFLSWKLTEKN
jgi:uncharacterized membrane protein